MPDMWMDVDVAVQVPANLLPLIDPTDFKTIEDAIAYNEAGMALVWNFVTTAGVQTATAFTPTTAGVHDWLEEGTDKGMYSVEIPASAGTVNNDTEGFGWISGETTNCLPFRGPTIGFRAAALNNALIDGGDELDVNVTKVAGTAQTANDMSGDINTILARIIGTLAAGTHNPQGGDTYARLGAPAAASIAADLAVIDNFVDELESRLTALRASYFDKLNITGNVAASSEVTAIQNNTRVRVIVPPMMERPDSGSTAFKLHLYIYDEAGNMEAPDSVPTITAENETGASRAGNLGTVTLEGTGHYSVAYTVATAHAIEQLIFEWTVTEGAVSRQHGAAAQIVDTTAVDFTAADRTKLNTLPTAVEIQAEMEENGASILDTLLTMLDDPRAEPGQGAPPVNADLATKVDYLYKAWRNKKDNDGSTTKIYADDGSTVDHKQTTSEAAGTVTKGEIIAGP